MPAASTSVRHGAHDRRTGIDWDPSLVTSDCTLRAGPPPFSATLADWDPETLRDDRALHHRRKPLLSTLHDPHN